MQAWKIRAFSLLFLGCGLPSFSAARAEEEGPLPATLTFQYSGYKWNSTTSKSTDTNGNETERKGTSTLTADLVDSLIYVTIGGKLNLYLYPFQDGNALASVGYMVRDDLELGIDLGLNSTKIDEPKEEDHATLFGAFATYTVPVSNFALENAVVIDMTKLNSSSVSETTGAESTTEINGVFIKASVNAIIPIAKNALYFAGPWLAIDNTKNASSDSKRASSQFGLTLAGLRITVD